MRFAILLTIPLLMAAPGCQFATRAPSPQWVADFRNTDAIVIRRNNSQNTISDVETITRLRRIYESAKWKPYWHTLPGNLGDRTIDLHRGDTKLRRFSYTGLLWETDSYTDNRTAELSESDAQWIESLFARVPTDTSSEAAEKSK